MKIIRNFSRNRAFAIFLCFIVLYTTSCSKSQTAGGDSAVKPKLSGESMFREIFLFQGVNLEKKLPSLAGVISTLSTSGASKNANLNALGDQVVLSIKNTNPDFFNQLKSTVESKNLYQIKTMLATGATLYVKALLTSEKYGALTKSALDTLEKVKGNYDLNKKEDVAKLTLYLKNSLQKGDQLKVNGVQQGDCLTIAAVVAGVVWEAGAAVNVVAVLTAAVFIYAKFWGPETSSAAADSGNSLRNDQIALDIANNY